jgi:hypothetical protein
MAQIGKSTHFHAVGYGSQWDGDMIRVAQVGEHIFFRFGHNGAAITQLPADGVQTAAAAPAPATATPVLASLLPTPIAGDAPARVEGRDASAAKDAPPVGASAPAALIQPTAGPAPAKAPSPTA